MSHMCDRIDDIWGHRTPYIDSWPERLDERTLEAPDRWVQSACVLCSNGCGCDVAVKDGRIVGIRGRTVDRVNRGRLGPKGLYGWEANNSADRLRFPLIRGPNGEFAACDWDEAMTLIVERTRECVRRHTSGAIGFYTSGQLFLEEYYTLGVIGKAGLGTPHMDGNTRLCTATAAQALKESFGTDGQPGSYTDFDSTEAILHVGHNIAETQTVLWARILDRRRGPKPPRLIVIDPRSTPTAKEADIHLAPRLGTNIPVLNGLLHLIIESGQIDRDYIEQHTTGFEVLEQTVKSWTPERVEQISNVPAAKLRAAADILGATATLVSTVLQGVYQSMQATAAAIQVNNLNLIRGLIGKPGCGVLQMNGQPTAQNTRECGADGDLPGFRNWSNPAHIEELARLWNVDPSIIPHWAPPTHAMQIFRYAEEGSIKMLWISGTNPAVSLPELARIRRILGKKDLFVIVQDAFMTETAQHADIVLPVAIWGEKTGCFTNVDRTVHISHQAVQPPDGARSDLDIFLDYARRMDFRDKDGQPLIKWSDAEGAFEAWKECSRGRPCDYSGMSYAKLSAGSGIQWPCNDQFPNGVAHLYTDGIFNTSASYCEDFGHNLKTGAARTPEQYRANDPRGKAFLHAADYEPPHEVPDADFPLWLTTGRVVFHFHTRTKTGRVAALSNAAGDVFVQLSSADSSKLDIATGDLVSIESRRGRVVAKAKVGAIEAGHVFMPFHYGSWDLSSDDPPRAANELTLTEWDPVSKQPHFKYAAVRIAKQEKPPLAEAPPDSGMKVPNEDKEMKDRLATVYSGIHVGTYLGLLNDAEREIAEAFTTVAQHHISEPDIHQMCSMLASWSRRHGSAIQLALSRFGKTQENSADRVRRAIFQGPRGGALGLLRDLHDLYLLVTEAQLCWTVLLQAAHALRDKDLEATAQQSDGETDGQLAWLETRIKQAAPQALTVRK